MNTAKYLVPRRCFKDIVKKSLITNKFRSGLESCKTIQYTHQKMRSFVERLGARYFSRIFAKENYQVKYQSLNFALSIVAK